MVGGPSSCHSHRSDVKRMGKDDMMQMEKRALVEVMLEVGRRRS